MDTSFGSSQHAYGGDGENSGGHGRERVSSGHAPALASGGKSLKRGSACLFCEYTTGLGLRRPIRVHTDGDAVRTLGGLGRSEAQAGELNPPPIPTSSPLPASARLLLRAQELGADYIIVLP